MKAVIRPVQNGDIPRASQLCQRTNQFNLTSKRYAESDVALFLDDPDIKMFLLQPEDRFGAMGQSGLIIFRKTGDGVEVDTFLLSCRIIGRLLDRALFCESLRMLSRTWQFNEIRASFIPTQKNDIVSGLWQDYGFSRISSDDEETYACLVSALKVSFPDVIELAENL
jgi:FkbH-like protein